jgi:hypothetical protein
MIPNSKLKFMFGRLKLHVKVNTMYFHNDIDIQILDMISL